MQELEDHMVTVHTQRHTPTRPDINSMREVLEQETGRQFTEHEANVALRAALGAALTEQSRAQLAADLTRIPHPIPPAIARATQATENAWKSIEAESGLLPGSEVAAILGSRPTPGAVRSLANDMRKRGALLAVQRLNRFLYPGCQFDAVTGQVKPWVAPCAELATEHGWSHESALLWLHRPTTYLPEGRRPIDVIDGNPQLVLDVAREAWEVAW